MVWSDKARAAAAKVRSQGALLHSDAAMHKKQAEGYRAEIDELKKQPTNGDVGNEGMLKRLIAKKSELVTQHSKAAVGASPSTAGTRMAEQHIANRKQTMDQFVKSRERK